MPAHIRERLEKSDYYSITDEASLKGKGYYKISDSDKALDKNLEVKLNEKGYYSINDDSFVKAIEAHVTTAHEQKKDYYTKGLIKELRERADEGKIPFDSLDDTLKATVPGESALPKEGGVVHVSPSFEGEGRVIKLRNRGKELIVFAKPSLDTNQSEANQVHLNLKQSMKLLGYERAYKDSIQYSLLADDFCSPSDVNSQEVNQACEHIKNK